MITIFLFVFFYSPGLKDSHDIDGVTYKPISANSFIMDLHLELIHAQHRVAIVLLDQLQGSGPEVTIQNTFEVQFKGRTDSFL